MSISKVHQRQIADTSQLNPQQIQTLKPQIGDTVINAIGQKITLDANNFDSVTKNSHDYFVFKQDGTSYFKNKNGIDVIVDGRGYTKNTDDDMASIKYSPTARDAWKASMHGDGNKAQQNMLKSEIKFTETAMGHVPTDVEAAKSLATVLRQANPAKAYYTKSDLHSKYDELKAVANKTPEQKATLHALGKLIFDPATFNKIDGINSQGVTDGTISLQGLDREANSV